ncbi:hypothetical protein O181_048136 [Austropuccinia psidii MF-1]|uniref:CCHC-type domain-containing protein n=1 Tax=Austropuccinia psidii MF-1 TaxID=1389203 RepID=A0A9Q3HK42_9BASI|nr:hypothetical protein [Austropuccinia psidii MF-1]
MSDSKPQNESTKEADMAINHGINTLKPKHILRIDGSNFQLWEWRLCFIINSYLQNSLYLQNGVVGNEKHEQFCHAILLNSMPNSIQDSIITIWPCHAIYAWLKSHYFVTIRSSQCVAFNKLQDDKAPSSLVMHLNKDLAKFKNRSGSLGDDFLMGQLLQRTIYQSMMDKLDTNDSCGKTITFASCVMTLESCYQRPEVIDLVPSFNSAPSPSTEDKHLAMQAMPNIVCHVCNKQGHMARSFPMNRNKKTFPTSFHDNSAKPLFAPTQYHAHSPIITPPALFPFKPYHPQQQTIHSAQPDLYQPRYQQRPVAGVKAQVVEIGSSNEPKTEVSIDDMANPGERQSSVSTNTAKQSFVTGVGSLIYPGYRGKHVIINGIFYLPDAAGTLISPGPNLLFVGTDILIGTKAEGPLLRAIYNGDGRKGQLPMFSRMLDYAIDNHDISSQTSSILSQEANISTIRLPLSPIRTMTIEHTKMKKKDDTDCDNLKN